MSCPICPSCPAPGTMKGCWILSWISSEKGKGALGRANYPGERHLIQPKLWKLGTEVGREPSSESGGDLSDGVGSLNLVLNALGQNPPGVRAASNTELP